MGHFISVIIFLSVLQILVVFKVESYDLKCLSQASWKMRANIKCKRALYYFCLYNNVEKKYVEGCKGPDWDRKGSKRIFSGDFTREHCVKKRFQPFIFWTNESMSDCIYSKSLCNEKGQIIYNDNSTKDDRTCRCDYTKSYAFLINPRHVCFCIPTEEDCSCYVKSCPVNFTLSANYKCTQSGIKENQKCITITKFDKTLVAEKEEKSISLNIATSNYKWRYRHFTVILYFLCIMTLFVAGGFVLVLLFPNWTNKKQQTLQMFFGSNHRDDDNRNLKEIQPDEKVNQTTTFDAVQKDEVRCLRLIHLLFRVACPVVRLIFNHEIQPNQLRKSLDRNKALLAKLYRKTGNIINDFQWNLLFKGETVKMVKSENFDIRLMIYLLHTLANIKVCDLYPLPTDTSTSAMLSRINNIRNETTQNVNWKLTEDQFNQYWNDIRQAVLKLASPHTFAINNDQEEIRLIGRLLSFNPISINNKQLCTFIDISEGYPAIILQKFISEYCILNKTTLDNILREEKHQLYHKRFKTVSCCQCTTKFPKCISEEHWEALYEITKVGNSHDCQSQLKECSESFVPKRIMTFDRFVAETLILHIPNILNYFISRICVMGFENFLKQNMHTINHFMENKMCCTCDKVPTGNILINEKEWNALFMKEDNIYCKSASDYCFCQFSVRSSIEFSHVDDTLLSKIFNVAGPFGVLYKIGQNTFSYFLNWTVDDQPLHRALIELLNIIEDKQFCRNMVSSISPQSFKTIADQFDAWKWMSKHLQIQRATTGNQHQIFVRDKDGLKVKSVQIPKDFPLPDIATKFDDLSPEENNFLLVFYGLKNMVYPVIKEAFNTKCPDPVLHEICMEIYRTNKQPPAKTYDDDDKSRKKRIYLTQLQKQQLFSANWTERRNIDLKLMIHILKQRPKEEDKADDAHQLEVVDNIRREIVQSSSGVLNETRFHDIMDCLQIAIMHFGGGLYAEKISHLRNVKRILE